MRQPAHVPKAISFRPRKGVLRGSSVNNAASGGEWLLIGCAIVLAIGLFDAAIKWARKKQPPGTYRHDS